MIAVISSTDPSGCTRPFKYPRLLSEVKSKRFREKQLSVRVGERAEGGVQVHVSCLQMTHCNHKLSRDAFFLFFRSLSFVKYEEDVEVHGKTASVTDDTFVTHFWPTSTPQPAQTFIAAAWDSGWTGKDPARARVEIRNKPHADYIRLLRQRKSGDRKAWFLTTSAE